MSSAVSANWWLYVLNCDDRILYTGITTDLTRRLQQHTAGRGAKNLRRYQRLEVVYQVQLGERSLALRAEYRFKRLRAEEKRVLVDCQPSRAALLEKLALPDE